MVAAAPAVLLCGDLDAVVGEGALGALVAGLRRQLPGVPIALVPHLCGSRRGAEGSPLPVEAGTTRRVVVGCAQATARRQHLAARLQAAGVSAGGTAIVDLRAAEGSSDSARLEQCVALLRAAASFVSCSDLEVPVRERTALAATGVSRRRLFRGDLGRRPVAVWRADRCASPVGCAACVLACPQGALTGWSGGIRIHAGPCTGCGVCVAACPNQAFVLDAVALDAYGAAAAQLVDAVAGSASVTGIAVVCQDSAAAPLVGEPWLPLRVPSLEMVSAGWMLQLARAGADVRAVGCEEPACRERGDTLERFVAQLDAALAPLGPIDVAGSSNRWSRAPQPDSPVERIELGEPEATAQALRARGALETDSGPWRAGGPGCPLGVIEIDAAGCSACGACILSCPTGALQSERLGSHQAGVSFDPNLCTACGACERLCPESVVTLRHEADGAALAAGRRVVATVAMATCSACGGPLLAGLSPAVMQGRLGESHPAVSGVTTGVCADCRLLAGRLPDQRVTHR